MLPISLMFFREVEQGTSLQALPVVSGSLYLQGLS